MNKRTIFQPIRTIFQLIVIALLLLAPGCGTGAFQVQIVPQKRQLQETEIKRDEGFFVTGSIGAEPDLIVNELEDILFA